MIIAATYKDGQIFQHFGHAEQFKLYETDNGKVVDSTVISTIGSGHSALASFLAKYNVDMLICGGIGENAQNALMQNGIEIRGGVNGEADKAVENFLNGTLEYDTAPVCSEHNDSGHNCGHHHH